MKELKLTLCPGVMLYRWSLHYVGTFMGVLLIQTYIAVLDALCLHRRKFFIDTMQATSASISAATVTFLSLNTFLLLKLPNEL